MLNPKIYYPPLGKLLQRRYQVLQVLNSGAFGQTYVAQEITQPGKPRYAIKHYQFNPDYPNLLKTSQRIFYNEAETLKKLGSHDRIPRFIDCFEEERGFYLVQELVTGQLLSTELSLVRYTDPCEREAQTIYFLWDLLEILNFIHSQGFIHCDLKPNNIIRRAKDGKLVLIDFGAAQTLRTPATQPKIISTLPLKSTVAVSPSGYIAAEQLIGKPYPSSDLYSLGIIAIQMLTGLDPAKFELNLETNQLNWHTGKGKKTTNPIYSEALGELLGKMVRYNYQERYQSAKEVMNDLEPLLQQARISVVEISSNYLEEEFGLAKESLEREVVSLFPLSKSEPSSTQEARENWQELEEDLKEVAAERELQGNQASEPFVNAQFIPFDTSLSKPLKPSMMGMLTRMGIVVAVLNAFAIALGIYTLFDSKPNPILSDRLAQADEAFQKGNFDEAIALAQSIPVDSPDYEQSQAVVQQWQKDWSLASLHFNAAESALQQQQWQNVLVETAAIPNIEHWQEKAQPLIEKAQIKAEEQAQSLVKQAFNHAAQKDFTQALKLLRQIAPQTSVGEKIAPKLEEYSRKQKIRAMFLLQQAYNEAAQRNFSGAIELLKQIPPDTPAGNLAQEKLAEYQQKQKVRQNALKNQKSQKTAQNHLTSQLNPGTQLQEIYSLQVS